MSASVVATTATSSTTAQLLTSNVAPFNPSMEGTSKKPMTTAVTTEKDENEFTSNDPLPAEIRKILSEVARTGGSQSLPWTQSRHHHESTYVNAALHPDAVKAVPAVAAAAVRQPPSETSHGYFRNNRPSASSSPVCSSNSQPFVQAVASRKHHRNGLHLKRRRISADAVRTNNNNNNNNNANSNNGSRVFLIRTSSAAATTNIFSQKSSGRNSGSEVDDSTQYECDSEGTSATSASERSVDRREQRRKLASIQSARMRPEQQQHPPVVYKALKDVVHTALELVLDYWFRRYGYKVTLAERRSNLRSGRQLSTNSSRAEQQQQQPTNETGLTEAVFHHRRQRLLALLQQGPQDVHIGDVPNGLAIKHPPPSNDDGPPFTIQRIAEVLVAPEKYYTKTHKLCNCLEKLLLVTSSSSAFGGSSGGDLGHGSLDELDAATTALEQGPAAASDQLKRTTHLLPSDELMVGSVGLRDEVMGDADNNLQAQLSDECSENPGPCILNAREPTEEDLREEAARVALRTKFDHDPNNGGGGTNRDVRTLSKSRGLTSSPPPPGLFNPLTDSQQALVVHGNTALRNKKQQLRPDRSSPSRTSPTIARSPSPILFSPGDVGEVLSPTFPMSPLSPQQNSKIFLPQSPENLRSAFGSQAVDSTASGIGAASALVNTGSGSNVNTASTTAGAAADGADLEVEPGRSSASNSDVDSESDDISLDDSASDRSDGSDSGSAAAATSLHLPSSASHEPFTAARVMALTRMHQQQQLQRGWLLQQSRAFVAAAAASSLNTTTANSSGGSLVVTNNDAVVRHQAEVGYQSGDSIDSMKAEDSGGSDSSSSDFAD